MKKTVISVLIVFILLFSLVACTPATLITEAEAKDIALEHANLTPTDVTFTKVELDIDDREDEYEFEFTTDKAEYEYTINSETGAIISYSTEAITTTTVPATTPALPSDQQTETAITEDEAITIALDHAGLAESDTSLMLVSLDFDDGIQTYNVEFRVGFTEYEYEIDIYTSEILSYDKD